MKDPMYDHCIAHTHRIFLTFSQALQHFVKTTAAGFAVCLLYFTKDMFKLSKNTSYFMDLESCPILIFCEENRMLPI